MSATTKQKIRFIFITNPKRNSMEKYFELAISALIECVKNGSNDKLLEEVQFNLQLALEELSDADSKVKASDLLEQVKALRGL